MILHDGWAVLRGIISPVGMPERFITTATRGVVAEGPRLSTMAISCVARRTKAPGG